jgi:hypothetical protein
MKTGCLNDTRGMAYCGPTVVSAITGQPVSKVKAAIWNCRPGSKAGLPIKGTSIRDLENAFRAFGYDMVHVNGWWSLIYLKYGKGPTLAHFLRERDPAYRNATLVINVTNHWVAVTAKQFCDTMTEGQWVWQRQAPGRRRRVEHVYLIVEKGS